MKMIIFVDWADDFSEFPAKTHQSRESGFRNRRIMKYFEAWRKKQRLDFQLILWQVHYPGRFVWPKQPFPADTPLAFECRENFFERTAEAAAKYFTPDEPIFLADDSIFFDDALDFEPLIEAAMRPGAGVIQVGRGWLLGPAAQRMIGGLDDPAVSASRINARRPWTEADFLAWDERTTWVFAKTYAESAPHEYAVLGKGDTKPEDLYDATMFILRNGFVQMYYNIPFFAYQNEHRRYWSCGGFDLINRTLHDDLKTYQ